MTPASIPDSAAVVVAPGVLSSAFDEGFVILNPDTGIYYELDQVGARIWESLKRPVSVGSIAERITADYDVDRARCERDIRALLRHLLAKGLVRVAVA